MKAGRIFDGLAALTALILFCIPPYDIWIAQIILGMVFFLSAYNFLNPED